MIEALVPRTGRALATEIAEAGFSVVTGVPDFPLAELTRALADAGPPLDYVPGLREDSCLAWAAGASLAGRTPLILMRSAGLGNCLDVLTSLVEVYALPVVLLVSWAGHADRDVPHHNVIGGPLQPVLDALGIPAYPAALASHAQVGRALRSALAAARSRPGPAAVLGIPDGL